MRDIVNWSDHFDYKSIAPSMTNSFNSNLSFPMKLWDLRIPNMSWSFKVSLSHFSMKFHCFVNIMKLSSQIWMISIKHLKSQSATQRNFLTYITFKFNSSIKWLIEVNTELLLCVAFLSPRDSFFAFDKERLIRLTQFYLSEFSPVQLLTLDSQFENYFLDVCSEDAFLELEGIGDFSIKMVETRKHIVYPLVYSLLKLSLILLVATCNNWKNFLSYEDYQDWVAKSDGWSMVKWLSSYLYIERFLLRLKMRKSFNISKKMLSRRGQL